MILLTLETAIKEVAVERGVAENGKALYDAVDKADLFDLDLPRSV